jgi:hypothetical protein
MRQKVAILLRQDAIFKSAIQIIGRVQSPLVHAGERWIGDDEIEGLQAPSAALKCGLEVVLACQVCRGAVMQHHVHACQAIALSIPDRKWPLAWCGSWPRGAQRQQRARAAGEES